MRCRAAGPWTSWLTGWGMVASIGCSTCWMTSTAKGWGSMSTSHCRPKGSSAAWTRRRGNDPPDRFLILLHIEWRGKPGIIRVDNGPEYISGKLLIWAEKRGITIQHIQPGQPQQNAYIHCPADDAMHRREGSVTTAPSGMNGSTNTSSKPSRRPKTTPRNGSGLTTTTARTSLSWFAGKPLPGNGASAASLPP